MRASGSVNPGGPVGCQVPLVQRRGGRHAANIFLIAGETAVPIAFNEVPDWFSA